MTRRGISLRAAAKEDLERNEIEEIVLAVDAKRHLEKAGPNYKRIRLGTRGKETGAQGPTRISLSFPRSRVLG
jgi:hypothetical protein